MWDTILKDLIVAWEFFQNNILMQPQFFIGLIVLVGYLLLNRKWYDALAGFIKATVGYMILSVASGGLVNTFRPILAGLGQRFDLQAAVLDPYFGQNAAEGAIQSVGRSLSLVMIVLLIGFITNILLVIFSKWTKVRTLFITGHIMVQQSTTALWVILVCFPLLNDPLICVLLGILIGTYWGVFSNLTVEPCRNLSDGENFAVGHQQMFGIWLTDKVAPWIGKSGKKEDGKESKRLEDIKLPGFLSIFNDNIVATSILMTLFFGIIMIILGRNIMEELDPAGFKNGISFGFYIINKSFSFAVYLSILQLGVRMFVSELTESFQGISSRLLKGSVPAVDCAVVFGFGSSEAVTLGFLMGAFGQFLAIIGIIVVTMVFKVANPIIMITGFVPVFFDNATFATFANKRGGLKAALIIPFLSGIIQVLGGAFATGFFGLGGEFGGWIGCFDWDTIWPLFGVLMKNLQYVGFGIAFIGMLVIAQVHYRNNKNGYFEY